LEGSRVAPSEVFGGGKGRAELEVSSSVGYGKKRRAVKMAVSSMGHSEELSTGPELELEAEGHGEGEGFGAEGFIVSLKMEQGRGEGEKRMKENAKERCHEIYLFL
jgi:hypothetical protein